MSWIILEGLDRSGKTSVAEFYKNKGFHYIHMEAPDKKYREKGYTGPGYVDEILELYTQCDGLNVIFDRSIYGEKVWPAVYGRNSQLSYEDFEILRDFEEQNGTEYILMWDQDYDAHWNRCVTNNEPLTLGQFNHAVAMYERLENNGFVKKQLTELKEVTDFITKKEESVSEDTRESINNDVEIADNKESLHINDSQHASVIKTPQQIKLETANAINALLSSRIIKRRGDTFDSLETDIRDFLQDKLSRIFGVDDDNDDFTEQEKIVLKLYAQRILEKQKEQK